MTPRILLLNPPIHDFSAYDFWLKPYGLLRVAGMLRGQAEMVLYDSLRSESHDPWGRGPFPSTGIAKPAAFDGIPRRYRRFGRPRGDFRRFLAAERPFDIALVQTGMTYWYPAIREVLDDLRSFSPRTKTVLGGVYATLCPDHARSLGADLVVEGAQLEPLWQLLGFSPAPDQPPLWESYSAPQHPTPVTLPLRAGVIKLTSGCPFRCTYCAVARLAPRFAVRPVDEALAELELLVRQGARDVAFYDDSLLHQPEHALMPFLEGVLARGLRVRFHTPNALNASFVSAKLAGLMVRAGVSTFYLGFESRSERWQTETGGKLHDGELEGAVKKLLAAGAARPGITAYVILGHPRTEAQELEASMALVERLGIRLMLSEFSPIPGTPDGEAARRWVDIDEPLNHNKTAFAIRVLGASEVNRLKDRCRVINSRAGGFRASLT